MPAFKEIDYNEPSQDGGYVWLNRGIFIYFSQYFNQHCFICSPKDCSVSEDAGIETRTVTTSALAVRRSNNSARSRPLRLDLILCIVTCLAKGSHWLIPQYVRGTRARAGSWQFYRFRIAR